MSLQNKKQICCPYCYFKLIETKSDKLLTGGKYGFFVKIGNLKRHVNKSHLDICSDDHFPCPYEIDCGLSFCSIEELLRHVTINHFCTQNFPKIGSFCSHANQTLDTHTKLTQKKQEFLIITQQQHYVRMNLKT